MSRRVLPLKLTLLIAGSLTYILLASVPTAAQVVGNDPWSWCNYHPYSQYFNEEECKEKVVALQSVIYYYQLPSVIYIPAAPAVQYVPPAPSPSYSSTGSTQTQNQFRYLMEQHSLLAAYTMMARYDGRADYQAWQQSLDQNTQQLGNLVGTVYGQPTQNDFLRLWQSHIDWLGQYTDAVKAGDTPRKEQAVQGLSDFVESISTLFQNPVYSEQDLRTLFQVHVNDETTIIDKYASGNQASIPGILSETPMHADMIADAIYAGPAGPPQNQLTPPPSSPVLVPLSQSKGGSAPAAGNSVTIQSMSFTPVALTVKAGGSITWINNDTVSHTATADNGSFDTGTIGPGQSVTLTLNQAGNYSYHCSIHPYMRGTMVVQ